MSDRNLQVAVRVGGTLLELGAKVAPEVCAALDEDGPGGRHVTAGEGLELALAIGEAILGKRGDRHAQAQFADLADQVRELARGGS